MTPVPVELESERLVLEPLSAAHARVLYASLRDEMLYRYVPQEPPVSEYALRERFRQLEGRQSPDGKEVWLNWALRLAGTTTYIGTLEATVLPDRTAYIAYMVFSPYEKHGYATEAMRLVLRLLAGVYQVCRIVAQIDTRNVASVALVKRLGFFHVAIERDADFFKGSPSDEYRYELDPRPTITVPDTR